MAVVRKSVYPRGRENCLQGILATAPITAPSTTTSKVSSSAAAASTSASFPACQEVENCLQGVLATAPATPPPTPPTAPTSSPPSATLATSPSSLLPPPLVNLNVTHGVDTIVGRVVGISTLSEERIQCNGFRFMHQGKPTAYDPDHHQFILREVWQADLFLGVRDVRVVRLWFADARPPQIRLEVEAPKCVGLDRELGIAEMSEVMSRLHAIADQLFPEARSRSQRKGGPILQLCRVDYAFDVPTSVDLIEAWRHIQLKGLSKPPCGNYRTQRDNAGASLCWLVKRKYGIAVYRPLHPEADGRWRFRIEVRWLSAKMAMLSKLFRDGGDVLFTSGKGQPLQAKALDDQAILRASLDLLKERSPEYGPHGVVPAIRPGYATDIAGMNDFEDVYRWYEQGVDRVQREKMRSLVEHFRSRAPSLYGLVRHRVYPRSVRAA